MHLEILVEDISGKKMLEHLVPKIIGDRHTFNIHSFRGIGKLPKDLKPKTDATKKILLDQLPRQLAAYGKTFRGYGSDYPAAVVVVCDLDDRCLKKFVSELRNIGGRINPCPTTEFCIAIEEGEAWLLGDIPAVKKAYPKAKDGSLSGSQRNLSEFEEKVIHV